MTTCVLNQTKLNGHCPYIVFGLSSHIAFNINKGNLMLSCHSYLAPKERNETYKQQCDVILKFEHLQL